MISNKRLRLLALTLAALALGSILLAACIRPGSPAGASVGNGPSQSGNNGEPTVHMGAVNFVQSTATVPKGSKLMLVDDGQFLHILQNGMWDSSGTAKNLTEPGAPTVNTGPVNGITVEIGPFTTAGIFHIYCTVHVNMNLVVTVQ